MIQEELRIGNWVDTVYNIPYMKITEIKNSVVCGDNCKGMSYTSLKPIPLTGEILLKCGFESPYISDAYSRYYYHEEITGLFEIIHGEVQYSIDSNIVCEMGYLHQLQNLFYAITGKELEVKL